jgi:hypothetical protein
MRIRRWAAVGLLCIMVTLTAVPSTADVSDNLLTNPGFELPLTSGWEFIGGIGDKRLCNKTNPAPNNGACMMKLKGGPGVAVLKQTLSPAALSSIDSFVGCQPAVMLPSMYVYINSLDASTPKINLKAKFTHIGTTYNLKVTDDPTITTADTWGGYQNGMLLIPTGASAQKVVVTIKHGGGSSKVYVDDVALTLEHVFTGVC